MRTSQTGEPSGVLEGNTKYDFRGEEKLAKEFTEKFQCSSPDSTAI